MSAVFAVVHGSAIRSHDLVPLAAGNRVAPQLVLENASRWVSAGERVHPPLQILIPRRVNLPVVAWRSFHAVGDHEGIVARPRQAAAPVGVVRPVHRIDEGTVHGDEVKWVRQHLVLCVPHELLAQIRGVLDAARQGHVILVEPQRPVHPRELAAGIGVLYVAIGHPEGLRGITDLLCNGVVEHPAALCLV